MGEGPVPPHHRLKAPWGPAWLQVHITYMCWKCNISSCICFQLPFSQLAETYFQSSVFFSLSNLSQFRVSWVNSEDQLPPPQLQMTSMFEVFLLSTVVSITVEFFLSWSLSLSKFSSLSATSLLLWIHGKHLAASHSTLRKSHEAVPSLFV